MSTGKPRWVTARKRHPCDIKEHYPFPCPKVIEPGERYVRLVRFPDDINSSPHPWVMRQCETCTKGLWPMSQPDLID